MIVLVFLRLLETYVIRIGLTYQAGRPGEKAELGEYLVICTNRSMIVHNPHVMLIRSIFTTLAGPDRKFVLPYDVLQTLQTTTLSSLSGVPKLRRMRVFWSLVVSELIKGGKAV